MKALTYASHDLVVATVDSIDVRFAGVVQGTAPGFVGMGAGEPSVNLFLSAVRGPETMARDTRFLWQRGDWAARGGASGPEATEAPPVMPGIAVFERITTHLTDEVGTQYRQAGGKVAGDSTEWDAMWVFVPAPPRSAQTLRLEFRVDGEPTGRYCELTM
ncbi:hypothetical protein E2F48_02380 [Arthrobacter crusticola]|uniref:Uncharacterized protein n=1 Tax=Arthrobacter crusticola TaxID=2547960 RepID=A0A4R5U301_9MICC|nr:hypothetical protein [Arthrobacter crusticola]TDK27973.1 hypothetical protein E2F48_02380 [Arthrobacter crusticola]